MATTARSRENTAVLSAFKALQDRIRRLEQDRSELCGRAAQLRSELTSREADSVEKREEFARDEIEMIESGRKELEKITQSKHLAEIELARSEERRKAAVEATQNEMVRLEDFRQETAASEGKLALVKVRKSNMLRELEIGKENVSKLRSLAEREEANMKDKVKELEEELSHLDATCGDEEVLTGQIEGKRCRQEDFLKSVMNINSALVHGSRQRKDTNVLEARSVATAVVAREDDKEAIQDDARNNRSKAVAGGGGGKKKKTKSRKLSRRKASLRGGGRNGESEQKTSSNAMTTTTTTRARAVGSTYHVGMSSSDATSLSAKRGSRKLNRDQIAYAYDDRPKVRTTKSYRLSSQATASKFSLKQNSDMFQPLKERMIFANLGPVPFLPSTHSHSFNVLAAVSKAVRLGCKDKAVSRGVRRRGVGHDAKRKNDVNDSFDTYYEPPNASSRNDQREGLKDSKVAEMRGNENDRGDGKRVKKHKIPGMISSPQGMRSLNTENTGGSERVGRRGEREEEGGESSVAVNDAAHISESEFDATPPPPPTPTRNENCDESSHSISPPPPPAQTKDVKRALMKIDEIGRELEQIKGELDKTL